jgi:uncharacterized membrane protein
MTRNNLNKHPIKTMQSRLASSILIMVGIFIFALGVLGPAVADLMPASGLAMTNGSPGQPFYRIVPAEESRGYLAIALMVVGFVLVFVGAKLRRRGS